MSRGLTDVPMVVVANKADLVSGDVRDCSEKYRHDIVNKVVVAFKMSLISSDFVLCQLKVRKSWKLRHIEVSARYNWNITAAFKELSIEILSVRNRAWDCSNGQEPSTCCISCIAK